MAVQAYIFIECEHAKLKDVYNALIKVGGVRDAKIVTGSYDIIAFVEASNFKVLGEVVMSKIQSIEHVNRTVTNVIID
ncbi:MAG: Lrp/AsnC ligand binding domain-containing protein [Thermodesulfobacteriota bacterium]